jgi:hypothetical protein
VFLRPIKPKDGQLWAVSWRDNYVHWMAWATWLFENFDKRFFPEWITVWDEWPPNDPSLAALVAKDIGDWREEARKDPKLRGGWKLNPATPSPRLWDDWPPQEIAKLEREEAQRREIAGNKYEHRPVYRWDERRTA